VLPAVDPFRPLTAPITNVQSANRWSARSATSSSTRLCTCALVALAGPVSELQAHTTTQMAMVLLLSME